MLELKIENLRSLVYGNRMNFFQKSDAKREFNQLEEKVIELTKKVEEMELMGKEATSLIANLKDRHGLNDVEEESQSKIMSVFKYEGKW